jgi:acetylornithine deacetylase
MPGPVEHLKQLIAMDTTSHRAVTELSAYVASRLETMGFRIERFGSDAKHNLVASIGPTGTDGLVLSGHMDTVPTEGQPWTCDPFTLTERGGDLLGRGTADMKGFLAATLTALEGMNLTKLDRELILIWTHDEEIGCLGSSQLAEQLLADGRPLPKACVIGEPTGFEVLRMHPGHVASEFVFSGAAAHSSRPDLGSNAIEDAADAISAIRQLARELESETRFEDLLERPWVAVNTATIQGGSAINIIPDRCTVRLGYRPLPGSDPVDVHNRVVERIASLGLKDVQARVLRITPSMLTDASSRTMRLLMPHASCDHAGAATFATDGGNLAKLGMEPLVFGPGSINVAHQADEFIPRADLERAVGMVEAMIQMQCVSESHGS